MKRYKLAASDLDSILPIEVLANPNGGAWPVQKFNECDVESLAERLRSAPNPITSIQNSSQALKILKLRSQEERRFSGRRPLRNSRYVLSL